MGHCLDNEELEATRKLHGLDKKSNIEEDIKNLEKYIELVVDKNYCDCNELNVICYGRYGDGSKNVANSIKNILLDYTGQKQINEEHQKENGLLREKVKELEKVTEKYKKALIKRIKYCNELEKDLFENCENYVVNKQKIKDKIEEVKKEENLYARTNIIQILEELLQEENK